MAERTALYRLYDAAGRLLYVGITDNPERRWRQHARDKAWWSDVEDRSCEWFDTRGQAERHEREVVQNESPLHNELLRAPIRLPELGGSQAGDIPAPLDGLTCLLEGPETIEQAKLLAEALNALPDLQKWLRERRQHVVKTLNQRDGISYTDMAPALGVKPERVSGIARGHSRTPRKKAGE
ncbi:GIY-YIG nuclease family protein [Streptomyces mirabilis]|uniref:GIY-YIG nuclease family protein n=1 Tax=Streptomyces mirabilis TaxID=68239 RepID=UPI0033E80352